MQTVQLRLMGGTAAEPEGRRTPRLLGRSPSLTWQLLATAPLPLGQLAPSSTAGDQDLEDAPSTAASSGVTPVSTRGSSMDQAIIFGQPLQLPVPEIQPMVTVTTARGSTAAAPEGTSASPFRDMSGADGDDDAGSDSGQLFSTDSLAAAAASLAAHQQQQQDAEEAKCLGRLGDRVGRSSGEDSAASAPQVAGMWVAGDSQVTRLTLQWTPSTSGSSGGDGEPPVAPTQEVSTDSV